MRGYCAIGLDNPKSRENVGGVLRASAVFGAALVVLAGERPARAKRHMKAPTDPMKAWRHIPTVLVEDVFDAAPFDCVPVAVDLVEGARELPTFTHPERALYIFGAEDATLGARILDRCTHKVVIPTVAGRCLNLAAAVNVVLYDRWVKNGGET